MNSSSASAGKKTRQTRSEAKGRWMSEEEISTLQNTLREAQETLDAIRNGEVDAVVVHGSQGSQIYSLAGAEQPYRVYVEQMQEGAVTVSLDGLILYCNQRFAEMIHLPLEKVISSSFTDRISADAWSKLSAVLNSDDDAVKLEDTLLIGDSRQLPVSFAASKLPLEDQDVICLVVADLTIMKEKESLRLAKELSDHANAAKDVFLAALSHELRTPLTPALIAVDDLESGISSPAEVREAAALIRRCIELETRLIDDLLDITRIVRGKLKLRSGAVNLHVALRRALEVCQKDMETKRLRLTTHLQADHCDTEGDMVRIQQVFWNVIRNAIKFTPEDGHITIRSGNSSENHIWFEITDSGIGFSENAPSRLFVAFEQEDEFIARNFGGLGMGLTISKSVVDAHGGSITARSEGKNKGATFLIELPLRSLSSRNTNTSNTPSPSPCNGSPPTRRRLRLLVVEDHKDTRHIMQRLLQRMGHEVQVAETGQRALDIAANQDLDAVISDLGLPDMTGWLLMQQLKDRHGLKGIAVSGFGTGDDVNESRFAGFIHHLTKPLTVDSLSRALRDF
jgi:signal transduction histidine kinase